MRLLDELLRLEGIVKTYGRQRALDEVCFDLRAGEIHCLVGENGAGKSTLIKVLSGAIRPDEGQIHVAGQTLRALNPRQAMGLGIATMYQDVELIDSLSVADNIFLGCECRGRIPGVVNARAQRRAAREMMDSLRIDIDETALVEDLTAAQKQMLEIVKAMHGEARVLIMDEPTSSLGLEETRALLALVKDLRARGVGIIYISHYLEEVFELADRVTVLKDGQVVGTRAAGEVGVDEIVRMMVGRDASAFFARERVELGAVQLEVRGLTRGRAVRDVSFSVRHGEIFALGGLVGSGRTELVELICGVRRGDAGRVLLHGRPVKLRSPAEAIRRGICLIPEDRKALALFGQRSVRENVMIARNELARRPVLLPARERQAVAQLASRLDIVCADTEQSVSELSGGNQQKTVIARWLLDHATVFVFDEPTKGVDIGAKQHVYRLMVDLARSGKSVVMVSSDMPELISLSDRIGVMRQGRLVEIVQSRQADEQRLIELFTGTAAAHA